MDGDFVVAVTRKDTSMCKINGINYISVEPGSTKIQHVSHSLHSATLVCSP